MKKAYEYFFLIVVLMLPSACIELLSGATPPQLYFKLETLFFFGITYGIPFIFLRELKLRWQLTWQYLFLFPIMGIFIEGIFMQSFFNSQHIDLGPLRNIGVFGGVQWAWVFYLVFTHGVFAVTIPLYIIDRLFPKKRLESILNRKRVMICSILLVGTMGLQNFLILKKIDPMYANYQINFMGILLASVLIALLLMLAYRFKDTSLALKRYTANRFETSIVFIYMISYTFATYFLAINYPKYTVLGQWILACLGVVYTIKYIYGMERRLEELNALYNGVIMYAIIFALLQGFHILPNPDPTHGMEIVGGCFIAITLFVNHSKNEILNENKKEAKKE